MSRLRGFWRRLPESVRTALKLYAVGRVVFWAWGGIVVTLLPLPPLAPQYDPLVKAPPGFFEWVMEPWDRWDVIWYNRIAVQGYAIADGRAAFAPLFPLLVGLLGRMLGGQFMIASFIVSDLACIGSLILLHQLAQREGYSGMRTLMTLLLFPFAFFLFIPYTESTLLFFTLLTFSSARADRWRLAALFGALAVLTKVTALTLLAPLAWELWERRGGGASRRAAWLTALPLAWVGWVFVREAAAGRLVDVNLSALFLSPDFQKVWSNDVTSLPWDSLIASVTAPFRLWPHPYVLTAMIDLLILFAVIDLMVRAFRSMRRSYSLYALGMFLLSLIKVVVVVPLQDAPRRWMMAFPLFFARDDSRLRGWKRLALYGAVLLQALVSALFVKWLVIG